MIETFKELMEDIMEYDDCELDTTHENTYVWCLYNTIKEDYEDVEVILLMEERPAVMFHTRGCKGSIVAHLNEDGDTLFEEDLESYGRHNFDTAFIAMDILESKYQEN